ncbi:hypothetical protein [Streptacidiphilus carbonis]|jgi:hypothetical protein|uniref:hypothetical protein n=1 Tax=Streptacidiphilus carbonis TaxID=105422 RepID=UPI0005A5D569|nr:hypothetical protein [Streptacidiphilus carbonis]
MRVLLTAQMDTDKGNQAIKDKTLPEIMKAAIGALQPEAAYFGAKEGCRTAFIVFDLKQASDIPSVAEPFFRELGAKVEFIPVMNFDDVQSGLGRVD